MTYLDLLVRIKNNAQPKFVLFNNDLYRWSDFNYKNDADEYISENLDEISMCTKNCIKAIKFVDDDELPDEPETKTLGDIIAEKCF